MLQRIRQEAREMKRAPSLASGLSALLTLLGCLALPAAAAAQNTNTSVIPTLDGVGLAALAGVLSIGGSWWLWRHRDKDK
jgi:hypothetical protein